MPRVQPCIDVSSLNDEGFTAADANFTVGVCWRVVTGLRDGLKRTVLTSGRWEEERVTCSIRWISLVTRNCRHFITGVPGKASAMVLSV